MADLTGGHLRKSDTDALALSSWVETLIGEPPDHQGHLRVRGENGSREVGHCTRYHLWIDDLCQAPTPCGPQKTAAQGLTEIKPSCGHTYVVNQVW